jgi:predicted nucleotidyltransferase
MGIEIPRGALAALCRRHDIRRLSLFGSVLKGTERPDSDVDLLVEFTPGKEPGLLALAGIESELSDLLGGRRIDLRTPEDWKNGVRVDFNSPSPPPCFWRARRRRTS